MAGKDINSCTFSTPEQISICCAQTAVTHVNHRNKQLNQSLHCYYEIMIFRASSVSMSPFDTEKYV